MVSHEQPLSSRKAAALFTLAVLAAAAFAKNPGVITTPGSPVNARKFYPDDPLLQEPQPRPVNGVAARHVDDIYDFLDNSFATRHRVAKAGQGRPRPALDVNTLGDVPDSAWYTRRHYYRRMSLEELKRGPGNDTPPAKDGVWRIISAKSDGVTPGFAIEDRHKNRYLLKFDRPDYPELGSAADVIGSKVFYALGYYTPENYIVHLRREDLVISERLMWRDANGKKRPLTPRVLDDMLAGQPKAPDGTYRALASRWIAGELAGPFSYEGMRTDDPNDVVPHEDRRELRGLRVFASWLNHHDTRSINSMDSLVEENGIRYLRHYLMDFGSILGSDGAGPKLAWSGHKYAFGNKSTAEQIVTFGFHVPRWARADYPKLTGVGLFDAWSFDAVAWKPNYPNPAFLMMDREDAFWAAKQVAAFTDDEIRALVETGEYSDPRAAAWVADCLIERRDKIAKAWLPIFLRIDNFRIDNGKLAFEDPAAAEANGGKYSIRWTSWDAEGRATPVSDAAGRQVPSFQTDTQYLAATIAVRAGNVENGHTVTVYLRRSPAGAEVVGIDRT